MTFDSKKFALRYATIYTSVLAVILITPLIIYVMLLLQIDEAKLKLALEKQTKRVIDSMNSYKNEEKIFHFPRYKEYQTALYTRQYDEIFSTLDFEPSSFSEGFYHEGNHYYMIYTLPDKHYFGSKYLFVSTIHTANDIYFFALLTILAILVMLFIFSLLLLKNFSAPFEAMNRQLDNFIKDSMHEINTPLSIINLNVDLFANKHGENKYLQRIKSASKTLATIYDDMDFLIKQGRVKHKIQEINMCEFIQARVNYFGDVANLKDIKIYTDIKMNISIRFSKVKLQRIIDNTISNAIKYSYDGGKIDIRLYKRDKNIYFEVQDYGVGIAEVNKIFSRYYREDEAKGGFGIGLNIVKDIIDDEGITLEVESKVKKGSRFCYVFY
ncbi:histidine kinase [hydrothermal vent metagenome]|uniref:histidine kinase n=1 Tax=hydrothermal vent metagenome TaxID=652676 RepID=A0A1W1CEZ5_9ZZZZ